MSRGATSDRRRLATMVLALAFLAAPTAGDIGSCGQEPDELDPEKFFAFKDAVDCRACSECGITTDACARACDTTLEQSSFPEGCFPLVHDGEVCLNALAAAGCDDYATFVSDTAPTVPTECNFCPAGAP